MHFSDHDQGSLFELVQYFFCSPPDISEDGEELVEEELEEEELGMQ